MKFSETYAGHEITGEYVNPGDWFGEVWIIEVGVGFSSLFYAVEAGNESDAIDVLTDSRWGHIIKVDESDDLSDVTRAGNAGDPISLTDVAIRRPDASFRKARKAVQR